MSQLKTKSIVDMVRIATVVEAVEEAKKRIPNVRTPTTFFSVHDVWLFQARMDTKVCPLCRAYETSNEWNGNVLRSEFPYLMILDENTIGGRDGGDGLVHPNCRCRLVRKLGA